MLNAQQVVLNMFNLTKIKFKFVAPLKTVINREK